jgi:hypothetical protein
LGGAATNTALPLKTGVVHILKQFNIPLEFFPDLPVGINDFIHDSTQPDFGFTPIIGAHYNADCICAFGSDNVPRLKSEMPVCLGIADYLYSNFHDALRIPSINSAERIRRKISARSFHLVLIGLLIGPACAHQYFSFHRATSILFQDGVCCKTG